MELEDITRMINTNIKNSSIRIENLFKSIFSNIPNTSIHFTDNSVIIRHSDTTNIDSASIEIIEIDHSYRISYWDGYSLAEEEAQKDLNKALKVFKRYAKKLAKNLLRFSQLEFGIGSGAYQREFDRNNTDL